VIAAAGEHPVFDGGGGGAFVAIKTYEQRPTNLVFDGLTIQRYFAAFSLDGGNTKTEWAGKNVIRNCVLAEIGDRNGDGHASSYGAIVWEYQRDNLVENNVFWNIYSDAADGPGQIHAVYLSHGSSNNVLRNNFIHNGSHDPFRLRDGANNNLFSGNYVDRAGGWAPATRYREVYSGEDTVHHNRFENNLLLYGHGPTNLTTLAAACFDNPTGTGSSQVPCGGDEWDIDATTLAFFRSTMPAALVAPATALGDFDGDGQPEAVVALRSSGIDRVVKSKLAERYLGDVLWKSTTEQVVAMVAGDFDASGRDQLVTAFRSGAHWIVRRGTGVGEGGLADLGTVLTTDSQITALAAGDLDQTGKATLAVALWDGTSAHVRIGDHTIDLPGLGRVTAMTTADLDGDGAVELVTAVAQGANARVYVAHGVSNLTAAQLPAIAGSTVTALAAGELDGDASDGAELVTALSSGEVWQGDGTSAVQKKRVYQSSSFGIPSLSARARAGSTAEILTAFVTSTGSVVQVWLGDQTALTSTAKLFEWPAL
jgi:hypothetical protein